LAIQLRGFFCFLSPWSFAMSQQELESAISQATGESLRTIRRRGFSLERPLEDDADLALYQAPQTVDWDALDAQRRAA
jgi:hypothetical protein